LNIGVKYFGHGFLHVASQFSGKDALGSACRHPAGGRFLRAFSGPFECRHHYFHAVLLALLFLFGSIRMFVRRRSRTVVEDERDRAVAAIGARWSNIILWLGLIVILVIYWDHGSMQSAHFLIGVLFHLLMLAGAVRIIRELVAYRMSA
jgi:hypothetical protein